jgi:hypothetical protein
MEEVDRIERGLTEIAEFTVRAKKCLHKSGCSDSLSYHLDRIEEILKPLIAKVTSINRRAPKHVNADGSLVYPETEEEY